MPRLSEKGVGRAGQFRVESKAAELPAGGSAMEGMREDLVGDG